jgi:murein DD-endopeptidase MepM/ murein hydrolase activator NlpD
LEIGEYVAEKSDTVLGIAAKFGLKPETIMWGNPILRNNPHFLEPGQTLRIPPADGVIRDVVAGDTIGGLARAYGVKPEDIIGWPANNIDPDNPQIIAGQVLFVPGGARESIQFTGFNPSGDAASPKGNSGPVPTPVPPKTPLVIGSGSGQCPPGFTGGVAGAGAFIWPADHHYVSGYDYSGIHPGIDIDGDSGEPAYAADSGIVVFAGWSEWGFGNTIIVDHGNKTWTLYGHLSGIFVGCGQGVYQGNQIGAIGNTGRSAGSHLHFEVYYGPYQTNPWNVLPPP